MGAMTGMAGHAELWSAAWMALALTLTGASVVCGLASFRRPRHPARTFTAATVAVAMVASTLDMALPVTLLPPLAWAAVLLALTLVSLVGNRPVTAVADGVGAGVGTGVGARRAAAQHAAGLLFMAVMWLAMLPSAAASPADAAAPVALHAAHAQAAGSLLLPLGWLLIAAAAVVVVLVIRAARRAAGPAATRSDVRRRWAAAQHASMGLAMSAMTVGMVVPLMFS